jgi:hypothetical protein
LTEADLHPDGIAGISIGAINGPLIVARAAVANQMSVANLALASGASGFFTSRFPAPWLHLPGSLQATSADAPRGRQQNAAENTVFI